MFRLVVSTIWVIVITNLGVVNANAGLLEKIASVSKLEGGTSFTDFFVSISNTQKDHGEPVSINEIDISKFSDIEMVHFYFLTRMTELGWLKPLLNARSKYTCDSTQLRLQSVFVASFQEPNWCDQMQWDAANWLLKHANSLSLTKNPPLLRKLFLLIHTAGADLSPIEVKFALTNDSSLAPKNKPTKPAPPYLSQYIHHPLSKIDSFETWKPWSDTADPMLRSKPVVFFWNQTLRDAPYWVWSAFDIRLNEYELAKDGKTKSEAEYWRSRKLMLNRFRDVRGHGSYADTFELNSPQYFIGNELSLLGSFGLSIRQSTGASSEKYAGLKLIVNRLHLDRIESERNWGSINQSDLLEPPVIVFVVKNSSSGNMPIIFAREFSLGQKILSTPQRMWQWIVKNGQVAHPYTCDINEKFFDHATKQIDINNPHLKSIISQSKEENCIPHILAAWRNTILHEMSNTPSNILHRYISVYDGFNEQIFTSNKISQAQQFFSVEMLERWGLAAARQLKQRISLARVQDNYVSIGEGLRDTLELSKKFLTAPTSNTVDEVTSIFDEFVDLRKNLLGKKRIVQANWLENSQVPNGIRMIGTEASLDIWNFPNTLEIIPFQSDQDKNSYGRLWVPPNASGSDKVYLEFVVKLATDEYTVQELQSAISNRGYLYNGQFASFKRLWFRPGEATNWDYESAVPLGANRFLLTISVTQEYFPVFDQTIMRTGITAPIGWTIDGEPEIGSDTHGEMTLPLNIPNMSIDQSLEDLVSRVLPNSSVEVIEFLNRRSDIQGHRIRNAVVNFDILNNNNVEIQQGLELHLSRSGLDGDRKKVRLLLPKNFKIRYRVKWTFSDGSSEVYWDEKEINSIRVVL